MQRNSFADRVCNLQTAFTQEWHCDLDAALVTEDELERLIWRQHRFNFDLWHEEDKARDPDADNDLIATVKRNIDALNQQRNDAITSIDELLPHSLFKDLSLDNSLPWNSETVGSIVDRLSIAALKVFHMQEQADREDASHEHRHVCAQKTALLMEQQRDLAFALQSLVTDIANGRKQNKVYRQYKMYNDPNLNPRIYRNKK